MEREITVFVGPASAALGTAVCELLQILPAAYECRVFPDGEAQIDVQSTVRGQDVYILQATSPPVAQRLVELLLLADACRRSGAARLTAVIPYFGYARQDRRNARRSLGARVAADIVGAARFDRLMLIDAHTPAIEGFSDVPLDHLTAVPLLARAVRPLVRENSIVVAPDFGAVKLARSYANQLQLPMAFVHKARLNGESVEAYSVIGDVRGRVPLIVDDMLSTGATIEAAAGALRTAGAAEPISVAVTHALLVGRARDVLRQVPVERLVVTDTVTLTPPVPQQVQLTSVAELVATAVRRNHDDESLADLRASS